MKYKGDTTKMKIGEKISKTRRDVNLTQDQLAEALDVTRQTISKWESDLAYPEVPKIAKLAEVLNISCDYLLKEDKVDKQKNTITMVPSDEGYTIDWTRLYPILNKYQSKVDCMKYRMEFDKMMREVMQEYDYNITDAVLVLKDLLYQTFLDMKKAGKGR